MITFNCSYFVRPKLIYLIHDILIYSGVMWNPLLCITDNTYIHAVCRMESSDYLQLKLPLVEWRLIIPGFTSIHMELD